MNGTARIVAALTLTSLLALSAVSCTRQPVYAAPKVVGGDIVLETEGMPLDEPVFHTLVVNGRPVSFFTIRMNDGVHAFFDACVSCYQQKRGYAYREGRMVCRACSMEFSIYKLERGIGGCYPIKLAGRAEKGAYRIAVAAIEAEAGKF